MAVYDSKNIELVWRGLTLTGIGDEYKFRIEQEGDSIKQIKGVSGDGFNVVDYGRKWKINCKFNVDSHSLPLLVEDNLNHVEDILLVRDINTGMSDTFSKCMIAMVSEEQDSKPRTVLFKALYRNEK